MIYTPSEGNLEDIKISNDKAIFNNEIIDCSKEDRINTLISLFSCKEKWSSNDISNPKYDLYFEANGDIQRYSFDKGLPSNWLLFNAYINRLVRR
jgi:hypothetical protein